MSKHIVVIGAGFSGLTASCNLAKMGYEVTLLEKNDSVGGRARVWKTKGFKFDMGPSWYWMPDVIESVFSRLGSTVSEHYDLKRLDPSYKVVFSDKDKWDIPAGSQAVGEFFEKFEKGAKRSLETLLKDAKFKYEKGMYDYAQRICSSPFEFLDSKLISEASRLKMFSSFGKYAKSLFKDKKIRSIIQFPVLFLGATADKTPALYSMMNYADIELGTWYPVGGMHKIVEALVRIAEGFGVRIITDSQVDSIQVQKSKVVEIAAIRGGKSVDRYPVDGVVAAGDYSHMDSLLPENKRNYRGKKYWKKKVMAPSCLLYYIGVKGVIPNLSHHTLFFDEDLVQHSNEIYEKPVWPTKPLFYTCNPSKTDTSVAPEGCDNLFILVPVASGLEDTEEIRERYFNLISERIFKYTGFDIRKNLIVKRSYAYSDFVSDYNACRGNAYGLANTLLQTAFLKPKMLNKRLKNFVYAGQLTVPGPGVPPSMLSGLMASDFLGKNLD